MKEKTYILVVFGHRYFVYHEEPNWHKHNCLEVFNYEFDAIKFIQSRAGVIKRMNWKYNYKPKV